MVSLKHEPEYVLIQATRSKFVRVRVGGWKDQEDACTMDTLSIESHQDIRTKTFQFQFT